jgi:glycine amidinotransferase
MKCGRDIFVGLSSTCNKAGIEWVRRFLRSRHGDTYRVHQLVFNDQHPMHIDATFIPVGPRKLIVHPTRVTEIPPMFTKDWQILRAPLPEIPDHHPLYFSSKWMQLNVLMLDEERVICTKGENRMIQALKNMGLKPIPVNFWNFNNFGGGIHCATLDVRRRGTLHDYFA